MKWRHSLSIPLFSAALIITVPASAQSEAQTTDDPTQRQRATDSDSPRQTQGLRGEAREDAATDSQQQQQQQQQQQTQQRQRQQMQQRQHQQTHQPQRQRVTGQLGQLPSASEQAEAPRFHQVSRLLDATVRNTQGEELGEITEIVVDPLTYDVKYVVLRAGAMLGVGGASHAVPWEAFLPRTGLQEQAPGVTRNGTPDEVLVLNITRAQLDEMEGFDGDNLPDAGNYAFVGQDPANGATPQNQQQGQQQNQQAQGQQGQQAQPAQESQQARQSGAADQPSAMQDRSAQADTDPQDAAARQAAQRDTDARDPSASENGAQRFASQTPEERTGLEDEEAARLASQEQRRQALQQDAVITPLDREHLWSHRVSSLIGLDIEDRQGEGLGEISDLVIEGTRGKLTYAVVSYGGTLGIGDNRAIVPWSALDLDKDTQVASLDTDRETLDQLAFDGEALPDMTEQRWVNRTHRAFGQEPDAEVFGYSIQTDEPQSQPQSQDAQDRQNMQAPRESQESRDPAAEPRSDRSPARQPRTPSAHDAERGGGQTPAQQPTTPSTGDMER